MDWNDGGWSPERNDDSWLGGWSPHGSRGNSPSWWDPYRYRERSPSPDSSASRDNFPYRYRERSPSPDPPASRGNSPHWWDPYRYRERSPLQDVDGSRRSQSPETRNDAGRSPSRSPARDQSLIGMGVNPGEWPEEPASKIGITLEEVTQLREKLIAMGIDNGERDANLLPARSREPRSEDWDLQQWSDRLMSTSSISNAELEQLRECLINVGNESGKRDVNLLPAQYREPRSEGWDLQQWSDRLISTSSISNAELEQLRECLINVGNESGGEEEREWWQWWWGWWIF